MCGNEKMLLLLSGHLDGCNTPEEEALLEAHLAECPDCRRNLNEYEKLDAGIGALKKTPPANFIAGVMGAVEAESSAAEKRKPRRFSFGVATAAAAAAAVLLLVIGSGGLPQLGTGSAKLYQPAMKSAVAEPASPAEEAPMAEEAEAAADAMFAPGVQGDPLPANVDCAALAAAEGCSVGLLCADPADLPELEGAPSLPLDGGTRYEITEKTLIELDARFDNLQIYEPDGSRPADEDPAFLIVLRNR